MLQRPKVPSTAIVSESGGLVRYENMCRALAEAIRVDEVMAIRDEAAQIAAAARIANNHQAEADAVVIRMRGTRKLGQLMQKQEQSVGLATGGEHGGRRRKDGSRADPSFQRPTLAMQGIGKRLADQARVLRELSDEDYKKTEADVHDRVARAARNVVREIEIEQERKAYRARTSEGCTVANLEELIAAGKRFGVIYADPAVKQGGQRGAENHYETESLEFLKTLPVAQLLADDGVVLLWCPDPDSARGSHTELFRAWEVQPTTLGFLWIKQNKNGQGLHRGMGSHTRANDELCWLGTRGSPLRLAADVDRVVFAPVGEHSEKPEEVRRRIERLYPGPYLELFGRPPAAPNWTVWGNEIPAATFPQYDALDDINKSAAEGFAAIRERQANGGPGWDHGNSPDPSGDLFGGEDHVQGDCHEE